MSQVQKTELFFGTSYKSASLKKYKREKLVDYQNAHVCPTKSEPT